jgi:hypothetical protein
MGAASEEHEQEGAEQGKQSAARADQDGASLHLTITVCANCEPKLLFGPS